ncbi:MAG: glycosyltransferase [Candidatus Hodarchaeota archaeon]
MISVHGDPLGVLGTPDTGGQCLYIKEIAKELIHLGCEQVDVYTRRWGGKPKIEPIANLNNCRVIRIPCGSPDFIPKEELKRYLTEFYSGLKIFMAENAIKYDIIHTHYWDGGVVGVWMAQDFQLPQVHTSHSLGAIKQISMPIGERRDYDERIKDEQRIYNASTALIAESQQEKEDLATLYKTSTEKIHIIPAGVDVDWFSPRGSPSEAKETLNLKNHTIILSLGRLDTRKGFDLLIKALPRINSELDEFKRQIRCIISAGSRNTLNPTEQKVYNKLMNLCSDLGIKNFQIIPRVDYDKVPIWYTAADVFVVPSRYEPFGLVIVEAMACKTPVVATNKGGPPDIITDGVEGYTVNPEDTNAFASRIVDCIKDPKIQEALREQARKTVVKKFSWNVVTKMIHRLYSSILG